MSSNLPAFNPARAGTAQVSGPYVVIRMTREKDGYWSDIKDRRKVTQNINRNINRVPHSR